MEYAQLKPGRRFAPLQSLLYYSQRIVTNPSLRRLVVRALSGAVRLRQGAERMRLDSKRHTRTLKNLFQEHGIPPWQRDKLPLLFCGDTLAAIPGIGVECGYQAAPGENGVVPRWERWR